jgi:hypothetical protein
MRAARRASPAHRRRIGRRHAIKDLGQARERMAPLVARHAGNRQCAAVAQQMTKRDRRHPIGRRQGPRCQVLIDIGIQRQPAPSYQPERHQGSHRLADRCRLKQRARRNAPIG